MCTGTLIRTICLLFVSYYKSICFNFYSLNKRIIIRFQTTTNANKQHLIFSLNVINLPKLIKSIWLKKIKSE